MRSLSVAACLLALAFAAFSQSDRGTITGAVSDPAGGVVPGAPVEARNVATGAVYPVATSSTGNYTIAQLPAGGDPRAAEAVARLIDLERNLREVSVEAATVHQLLMRTRVI